MKVSRIFSYFQHSLDFCNRLYENVIKRPLNTNSEDDFIDDEYSEIDKLYQQNGGSFYFNIKDKFVNGDYVRLANLYNKESTYKTIKENYSEFPELSLIGLLVCDGSEYRNKYFLTSMESNKKLNLENHFHKKLIEDIKKELFNHNIIKHINKCRIL